MSANFELKGSGAGAVDLVRQLNKGLDDTEKQGKLTAKQLEKMKQQAEKFAAQGDKLDQYNLKLKKLGEYVKKGALEQEQAEKTANRLRMQLDGVGKSGEKAFGSSMLARISAAATGMLSFSTVTSAVRQTLQEVEQTAQRAGDAVFNSLGRIGELQQVANNPQDFLGLLGTARGGVRRGVFKDEGAGADFTIATRNAGFSEEDVAALLDIGERKQISAGNLVEFGKSARKVGNVYGGRFGLRALADRIGVASKVTQASAAETAQASTRFSQQSVSLGYQGDSSLAALGIIEQYAGDINQAGVQLGALYDQILKRQISQGTLDATLSDIDKRVAAGENIYSILGESNAVKGYLALQQGRTDYQDLKQRLGSADGYFGSRYFLDVDPGTRSALARDKSAGALADASRRLGTLENLSASASDELYAADLRAGRRIIGAGDRQLRNLRDVTLGDKGILLEAAADPRVPLERREAYIDYLQENPLASPIANAQVDSLGAKIDRLIELQQQSNGIQQRTGDSLERRQRASTQQE